MKELCAGAVHITTKSSASPGIMPDTEIPPVASTAAGTPGSCKGSLMSNKVRGNPGCAHLVERNVQHFEVTLRV